MDIVGVCGDSCSESVSFNWVGAHHIDATVMCDLVGVVYADSFKIGVVL